MNWLKTSLFKRGRLFFKCTSLLLFIHLSGYAQDTSNKELANEYINQAELIMEATSAMVEARDLYVLAAEADPTNVVANWKAGEFHLRTIGKDRAVKYFLKVLELDPNYRFDIMYQIGRSYQYGMDFDNALAYYNRYLNKLQKEDGYRGLDKIELNEVSRRIYESNNAKEFVANPAHYSIINVGNSINSEYEEYAPVLNEDETLLIYTTRRRDGNLNQNVDKDNKPFEDIFIATKENGKWGYAENIGEVVNTQFHDSNLALSADGNTLFLYKDENNGDIYVTTRNEDGSWNYPEPLSENINSEGFQESSISISPDGNVLFFASDRPGGFGGIDIYFSMKDASGEWGRSKNLGAMINTEYDDDGPFIDYDGKTLYFSSQGRKGMGGHDIFRAEYDSAAQEWGEPENLGFPINTPDDDVYFVSTKDGQRGYYASVREDGLGFTDIYMVTVPTDDVPDEPVVAKVNQDSLNNVAKNVDPVAVVTTPQEKATMLPLELVVTVLNEQGVPVDATIEVRSTPDNMVAGKSRVQEGIYEFKVSSQTPKKYALSVQKDGYVFQNVDLGNLSASTEPQQLTRTVTMRKLELGTRQVLRNIYFDFDKATFKDESYTELNRLETMLAQNPGIQVEISGHTDKVGSKAYNKDLSQRRANAVKNYLVNKGIDARRIVSAGYGEEKPLASNDDELEGRELNRRVEFVVIGMDGVNAQKE
jgi:outer membrane protein OmpA-like peptidoglycan-associated protein